MLTFLEFYETLLKFVLFKLYQSDLGLNYPPGLDEKLEEYGVHTAAVRATPLSQSGIEVQQHHQATPSLSMDQVSHH